VGRDVPPIPDLNWFDIQLWGQGDFASGTSGCAFTVEGVPPDTGKQLWTFRRVADGGWQIVTVSYNSDLPPTDE
jgi:ketosteroid isomerase-like protein